MNKPVISREAIRALARRHHAKGGRRDEHNMNPGAAALHDWLTEWDKCEAASAPHVQDAAAAGKRADARQEAAV